MKGFMDGAGDCLTELERSLMPFSGKLITLEIGVRFLTDYLEGDHYFKTSRVDQNADRCRMQFKLVDDSDRIEDELNELSLAYSS